MPSNNLRFKKQLTLLWPKYFQVLVATLLINLLTLALPIFTHFVFDKVLPSYAIDTLVTVSFGMAGILAVDFILRWLRSYFVDDACRIMATQTEFQFFSQIIKREKIDLPDSPAETARVINDFAKIKESISSSVLVSVLDIPFFGLFTLAIWIIGGPLVWIPLAIAFTLLPLSFFSYRRTEVRSTANSQSSHHKVAFTHEVLRGLDTIRAMGAHRPMLARWHRLVTIGNKTEFHSRQAGVLLTTLITSASQISVLLTLIAGVFLIQNGAIAPGSLFACIILGSRAIAPLANLTMVLNRISLARRSLQQLDHLLSDSGTKKHPSKTDNISITGNLEFDDVSFSYPGDMKRTLRHISLQIKAGERVAIVGASGTGKTTLLQLLQGNLKPRKGHVYIDGQSLSELHPDTYRKQCAFADQTPTLFSGTIASNLLLGRASATQAEIDRACYTACLGEVIKPFREGLDHEVTEGGANLSGGQRQAIHLARAFLHGGKLIVLDEPASAYDNLNESLLCQRLPEYLSNDKTLIVVTHRSSLLSLVDRIIVLAEGRIVADGPRNKILSMMQQNG